MLTFVIVMVILVLKKKWPEIFLYKGVDINSLENVPQCCLRANFTGGEVR